ncbi:glycoside hydrolase family 88 protein [Aureibaculum sp. A20]|uniref:Glycoside hydrolase family 88 protein n=1 Tax=Aureibaculum flavum TaxID=2795986 RepID=A0ABS0WW30_9FLAO|nr:MULTISPECIES: glycoside hydrolase family 88 protein [Aureibaculum]MBJ2176206.1 glycoside hydrolase family 88 protein [Aureibaculum flavum]
MPLKKAKFLIIIKLLICTTLLFTSCKNPTKEKNNEQITTDSLLTLRYQKIVNYPVKDDAFPRSMDTTSKEVRLVKSNDWTSGFYPGNLWQLYKLTNQNVFKEKASEWTTYMEDQKMNAGTHDMGFKMYCSFGEGYEVTNNEHYKDILITSAKTLATRFNKNVGALRSWDFNKDIWEFPVIIDNMMNLELLFEATKMSGDSIYHKIAVKHANTTLKNQFRADNSVNHVVVYDTINGNVKMKVTHQGFNDDSSWARGQSWAIYGFTMAYRYTKDPAYLAQAEATATFFMEHPNLPEDGIPYWDFNHPDIPNVPRDASAATIFASALFEMYNFTKNEVYLDFSNKILANLQTSNYILDKDIEAPFILNHSTGNGPKNDEMDVPINYADYYFLEALLRKNEF